jgi:integrase
MPPKKKKDKLPAITQLPSGAYRTQIYLGKDPATGKKIVESFSDPDYQTVVRWAMDRMRDRETDTPKNRAERMTLGEALDGYIALRTGVLSPSTIREYKRFRQKCMQDLLAMPIGRVTQNDLQRAVNEEATHLSPKTVRNHHAIVTSVLAVYRPDFHPSTALPQKVKPDIVVPTDAEISLLFSAVNGTEMDIPVTIAACCGLRRSEICGLKWSDVNFEKSTLTIHTALVLDENLEYVEKGTKTTASKRTVPLMPQPLAALRAAYERTAPDKSDRITDLTPNIISQRFTKILERAEIRHFRFHDLRHYVVSVLLYLNVPKKYIADYVGHENENMIDQVYGHIMQDKKATFTDRLAEYLSKLS